MVAALFGLMGVEPVGQMMRMLLGIFDTFGVAPGKVADFEVKRQVTQVKINGPVFAVFFGLDIGVGQKHL